MKDSGEAGGGCGLAHQRALDFGGAGGQVHA